MCQAGIVGRLRPFSYNLFAMKKDAPLAFRIPIDLKRKLQRLAKQEARSLSQICEMLLRIGVEGYEVTGHSYLLKSLSSPHEEGHES